MLMKHKWKWLKTSAVLLATFNAGFNLGLFGPTLPDMQILTHSTTAEMSTTLIWTGVAGMIGAVFLGSLFDRFDGLLVISGCLLCQAAAFSAAPFPPVLPGFQIIISVGILFNIGLLTGTMSVNSEIWRGVGSMRAPLLQATDLVHSLGTAVAPLAVAPFLGRNNRSSSILPTPNSSMPLKLPISPTKSPNLQSPPNNNFTVKLEDEEDSVKEWFSKIKPVQVAYLITGLFDAVVAVVCLVVYVADKVRNSYLMFEDNKSRLKRIRYYSTSNTKDQSDTDPVRVRKTSDILFCKKSHGDYISERKKRKKNFIDLEDDVILEVEVEEDLESNILDLKSRKAVLRESFKRELSERRESLRAVQLTRDLGELVEQKPGTSKDSAGAAVDDSGPEFECSWQVGVFSVAVVLSFVTNGGRDTMMIGLLYTYVDSYLHWQTLQGAVLVTAYHFTRTLVHLLFVYLAHRASPIIISTFNVAVLFASSTIMLASSPLSSPAFTYVCVVLTAVATSNIHPTAISFVHTNIQITGSIMGVLYGAISAGQIIYAPILGVFFEFEGAVAFPSLLFVSSIFTAILFLFSFLSAKNVKAYFRNKRLRKLANKRLKNEKLFNEASPLIK